MSGSVCQNDVNTDPLKQGIAEIVYRHVTADGLGNIVIRGQMSEMIRELADYVKKTVVAAIDVN